VAEPGLHDLIHCPETLSGEVQLHLSGAGLSYRMCGEASKNISTFHFIRPSAWTWPTPFARSHSPIGAPSASACMWPPRFSERARTNAGKVGFERHDNEEARGSNFGVLATTITVSLI
jgi:hypothetical protein